MDDAVLYQLLVILGEELLWVGSAPITILLMTSLQDVQTRTRRRHCCSVWALLSEMRPRTTYTYLPLSVTISHMITWLITCMLKTGITSYFVLQKVFFSCICVKSLTSPVESNMKPTIYLTRKQIISVCLLNILKTDDEKSLWHEMNDEWNDMKWKSQRIIDT